MYKLCKADIWDYHTFAALNNCVAPNRDTVFFIIMIPFHNDRSCVLPVCAINICAYLYNSLLTQSVRT